MYEISGRPWWTRFIRQPVKKKIKFGNISTATQTQGAVFPTPPDLLQLRGLENDSLQDT